MERTRSSLFIIILIKFFYDDIKNKIIAISLPILQGGRKTERFICFNFHLLAKCQSFLE